MKGIIMSFITKVAAYKRVMLKIIGIGLQLIAIMKILFN